MDGKRKVTDEEWGKMNRVERGKYVGTWHNPQVRITNDGINYIKYFLTMMDGYGEKYVIELDTMEEVYHRILDTETHAHRFVDLIKGEKIRVEATQDTSGDVDPSCPLVIGGLK